MLESIRMRNFRRFQDETITFGPGVNLIEGVNNAGKTTILYAIEYGLFGHVKGFKMKSNYTTRHQMDAGVELIFKGNDGNRYRLLRYHKIGAKGARVSKSHFTLKRYLQKEDGEEYVLSSDFGNTEELLALKMKELTGITKRLFEITVSPRQGTLHNILNGSSALDIVLGVTAADALTQTFRERKRDMEKELSQIPVLEAMLKQLQTQKSHLQTEMDKIRGELKTISSDVKIQSTELKKIEKVSGLLSQAQVIKQNWNQGREGILIYQGALEDVETNLAQRKYKGDLLPWRKAVKDAKDDYKKLMKDLTSTRSESDKLTKIKSEKQQKLGAFEGEVQKYLSDLGLDAEQVRVQAKSHGTKSKIKKRLRDAEAKIGKLQTENEQAQHERGDLEGRMSRRHSIKGSQNCEYCGAVLDPKKVTSDLKMLEKSLKLHNKKQDEIEDKIATSKNTIEEQNRGLILLDALLSIDSEIATRKTLDNLKEKESTVSTRLESLITKEAESRQAIVTTTRELSEINDLEKRLKKVRKDRAASEKKLATAQTKLKTVTAKIKQARKKGDKSEFGLRFSELLKIAEKPKADEFPKAIQQMTELVLQKKTEIQVILNQKVVIKKEMATRQGELKDRALNIDAEVSGTVSNLNKLVQKRQLADKYGVLAEAFKLVQARIRESASKEISKSSLMIHHKVFPESEVEDLRIRPEDYSVEVRPHDWDEMVPATVYQGGGMQLLLGIAYRLAIGDFVRGVPYLFADEPTYGADSENRKQVLSCFKDINVAPQTLLVTHQSDSLTFEPPNRVSLVREGNYSTATITKVAPPKPGPKKTAAKKAKTKPKKKTSATKKSAKGDSK